MPYDGFQTLDNIGLCVDLNNHALHDSITLCVQKKEGSDWAHYRQMNSTQRLSCVEERNMDLYQCDKFADFPML